jgi:hypothetical protein
VLALAGFDDGSGPVLVAGGDFAIAGGIAASHIAQWNGTSWAPLGAGLGDPVLALTAFDDGRGNALHAGGFFTTSPAGDSYLAKWGCTLPIGARTFGASSPGCAGALAVGATSSPQIGNSAFAVTCSNAPPTAPGVFLAGLPLMSPLPFQATQIWVSPILSPGITSTPLGTGFLPLPIPADSAFIGVAFALQFLWIGPNAPPPCPPLAVSASNGMVLTIQP